MLRDSASPNPHTRSIVVLILVLIRTLVLPGARFPLALCPELTTLRLPFPGPPVAGPLTSGFMPR